MKSTQTPSETETEQSAPSTGISRRACIAGGVGLGAAYVGRLMWQANERGHRASTVVLKASSYEEDVARIIGNGLKELGFDRRSVARKSVLLKPNLVEPSRQAPHINTHPLFVAAAIEAFRRLDAREVIVAEGQGHCRDSYLVQEQSGLMPILKSERVTFIDLNHDDVFERDNPLGTTKMDSLFLPRVLQRADIVVSLPKMKTHHWAGATLSMKNLFGVMPGVCYGWPKNVFHVAGLERSIVDICSTVRPHLAIVDGIVGMEGDGPIMGEPKNAGLVVMGRNLPAVDATTVRLMGLDPQRLKFLQLASGRLGPILAEHIAQRGENIADVAQSFSLPDHPHFDQFRAG